MSHMLPHLPQNTSTRSLSPTSPAFRPSSPSLSCPISAHSGLEHENPARPTAKWRIHGICMSHRLRAQKFPSPTHLRREELSWTEILGLIYSLEDLSWTEILGLIYSLEDLSSTDLILVQIRINHQTEFWEMTIKILSQKVWRRLKNWCRHALRPIKDTLRLRFSWKHCRLGSWRRRITKNAGLTGVCIWARRKLWFFWKTHSFRETRS